MTYILIAAVVSIALAVAAKFLVGRSWLQAGAFAAATALLINPLTYVIGMQIAKQDAVTFREYWNGYEAAADTENITCTRDGSCRNEYNCDPYTVLVTKTRSVSDGKGGTKTETYTETETRYHRCPYSTQETTYTVSTTLGDTYTIASHLMTGPQWRERAIPGGQVTTAPARWQQVADRIAAGAPGPVTEVNTYENYILASSLTLFQKYEGDIETLTAANLLPTPARGVTDLYHATKAYNVAGAVEDSKMATYATDVAYLNGAVGDDLHGDVHVVFVPSKIEAGPDNYTNALQAYWQSDAMGKDAISKNAIVIVMGVNNTKIEWARSFTGMPVGNEALMTQFQTDLRDVRLTNDLIGRPTLNLKGGQIKHTDGIIENMLWGKNAFVRVSMSGDGVEGAGFDYLKSDIQISSGTYWGIAIVNLILVAGLAVGLSMWANSTTEGMSTFGRTRSTKEDNYIPVARRYGRNF